MIQELRDMQILPSVIMALLSKLLCAKSSQLKTLKPVMEWLSLEEISGGHLVQPSRHGIDNLWVD